MAGKLFFSGNRLTQAVLAAARHFRLDPDQVAYAERSKSSGFLASPRVVIEVDPAAPKRTAAALAGGQSAALATPATGRGTPAMPARQRTPSEVPRPRLSEAREQELREMAIAAVDAARSSGEPVLLAELNPAERRIVHTTVNELGLWTESQGEERYKRILVRPAPDA